MGMGVRFFTASLNMASVRSSRQTRQTGEPAPRSESHRSYIEVRATGIHWVT